VPLFLQQIHSLLVRIEINDRVLFRNVVFSADCFTINNMLNVLFQFRLPLFSFPFTNIIPCFFGMINLLFRLHSMPSYRLSGHYLDCCPFWNRVLDGLFTQLLTVNIVSLVWNMC